MSTSGEPPSESTLVLTNVTVSERMLRPARTFGLVGLALAFAPPLVSVTLDVLRAVTRAPAGEFYEDTILPIVWLVCALSAPAFGIGSVVLGIPTTRGWRGPARVLAHAGGLTFERGESIVQFVPRAGITDAVVVPGPDPRLDVHLVRGNVLSITLPSEEQGHEATEKLGFSPSDRRLSIQLASPRGMIVAACMGLPVIGLVLVVLVRALHDIGIPRTMQDVLVFVAAVFVTWLVIRAQKPDEIVIGTDGVVVRRLFSRTYHSHADIEHVEAKDSKLGFGLRGAKKLVTAAKGEPRLIQAAAQRIEGARKTGAVAEDGARIAEWLDLGGRSVAAWRAELPDLLGNANYRRATVTPRELASVLENAAERRDRRLGAAMLLRIAAPEEASRIRGAADAAADEDLRAALERAAEEELDDAAIERALGLTRKS
ncbi:hypothetical protein [Polyangium spumosum]|uniref:Uncharacterized protein n=1 Tax=Polyangium spumosum TaxID=889282 RepID=A0A6N7PSK2_9BACT|nr:hypothetical protein [Polyangium spumosum]MRG93350.1 hypothetical protein [Polyangium spumosum]